MSMAAFSDALEYYKKENEQLNQLLKKERTYRKKIDEVAISFLKKVKMNYENKVESLNKDLESLRKEKDELEKEKEELEKEKDKLENEKDKLEKEKEEICSEDLKEAKFNLRVAQREISKQKDQIEYLRSVRREADEEAKSSRLLFVEKEKEVISLKQQCENLTLKLESIESENLKLNEDIQNFNKKIEELNEKNKHLKRLNDTLKGACSTVESQASELESRCKLQENLTDKLSKEKQLMFEKMTKLENSLEAIEKKYSDQITEMSQYIENLKTDISHSQKKIENLENSLNLKEKEFKKEQEFHFMYEKEVPILVLQNEEQRKIIDNLSNKLQNCEEELFNLKEEASNHITKITNLNGQNKNLAKGLEESLNNCETLQNRIEIIVNELETRQSEFEMEKLKMNETIHQQLKLIDLLQEKIEKLKKPWFGINSPATKAQNPTLIANKSNNQIRELEAAYERERTKNRMLRQQVDETKSELRHYKIEIEKIRKKLSDSNQASIKDKDILFDKHELENQLLDTKTSKLDQSLLSIPSAPPISEYEIENTSSSESTSTTDNNECFEDEQQFTFTDSILGELGERKISNIPTNQ